jgi:hypothetical protein
LDSLLLYVSSPAGCHLCYGCKLNTKRASDWQVYDSSHKYYKMNVQLSYVAADDSMLLSLRDQGGWIITRGLLLKLVKVWPKKLQGVDLLSVGCSLGDRNICQGHALSPEFDAPTTTQQTPKSEVEARLFQEVTLSVNAAGANLVMRGDSVETSFIVTRKESHLVLEMLAYKAKALKWIGEVQLPSWLG